MAGQMHDFGGVQQRFGGHTTPQNAEPADFFATLYHCRLQPRSEEHTSELQSPYDIVCRLLLEKKTIFRACAKPTTYPSPHTPTRPIAMPTCTRCSIRANTTTSPRPPSASRLIRPTLPHSLCHH